MGQCGSQLQQVCVHVCTRADVILHIPLTGSMGVSLFQWSSDMELFVFNSNLSSSNAIRVESIPGTSNINYMYVV